MADFEMTGRNTHYELLASAQVMDGQAQSHIFSLVSDGALFYDGRPSLSSEEEVVLLPIQTKLLGMFLDSPDTPLGYREIRRRGYRKQVGGLELSEMLGSDMEALGRVEGLGDHLVQVGSILYASYALTINHRDLSGIEAKYDAGEMTGASLTRQSFAHDTEHFVHWFAETEAPAPGYEIRACAVIIDNQQQTQELALRHDRHLLLDGDPLIQHGEPAIVTPAQGKLLGVLMDRPNLPLRPRLMRELGYQARSTTKASIEKTFEELGSIRRIGGHIVRLGDSHTPVYAFTERYESLAGIEAAHTYRQPIGSALTKAALVSYAARGQYWYNQDMNSSGHTGAPGTLMGNNELSPGGLSLPMPPEEMAEPDGPLVRLAHDAESYLREFEGLRGEINYFTELERIVGSRLLHVVKTATIADIINEVHQLSPAAQEISAAEIQETVLELISLTNTVKRYLPARFGLRVLVADEERQKKRRGEEISLPPERFYLRRKI
jgi:hypothetical protein